MKIAMVTGSYPPDVCGAGDYTAQLVRALRAHGLSVELITGSEWSVKNAPALLKWIKNCGADITHLQYPTVGYGRKLGPQLMALLERGVVTLHEASQTHILRRISLYPLLLSRQIIVTNCFERSYICRLAPWVGQRCSIIPIGSNIPVGQGDGERLLDEIVYFGLIRPAKGLESVMDLAALLKERGSRMIVRIIGLPLKEHQSYLDGLRAKSASLPIVWDLGLSDAAVADRLARAALAYAPFPDGASERRGSLLALLANGVATVTTRGPQTIAALDEAVEYVGSATEAAPLLEVLTQDADRWRMLSERGKKYASQFSWPVIADQHIAVYETFMKQRRAEAA